MVEESLRIAKPPGQVDHDYNLSQAITGGGQLKISPETYQKFLVSALKTNMGPLHLLLALL